MILATLALQVGAAAPPNSTPVGTAAAPARIHSVALFKNGLAWVRSSATIPGDTPVVVGAVPEAVHGTFWIGSDVPVTARSEEVEVQVPFDGRWEEAPQASLAGARVRVVLEGLNAPIVGRVSTPPDDAERQWSKDFETNARSWWWGPSYRHQPARTTAASRFLAIDDESEEGGTTYVPLEDIRLLRVIEPPEARTERRPGLRLSPPEGSTGVEVEMSYLTKGLSYAPSYRIELRADGQLALTQAAVLRNEMAPLEDVDVRLVTGFPNMPLSHVVSPLSPGQSWASFFQQLARRVGEATGNVMMMSQMVSNRASSAGSAGVATGPLAADEGVDLYYHDAGRHTLDVGESLQIETATGIADYERIVRWEIPDDRDEWGRRTSNRWGESPPDDGAWDALRFANPLEFPMTTAPATIVDGGRYLGEQLVEWTAPGAEVVVPVTKALAISTHVEETEIEGSRDAVIRWGMGVHRARVSGKVTLTNRRGEAVRMVVRRRFSGELEFATGEHVKRLLEQGVYSLNPRREIVWTLDLAPGETRELEYRYGVLTHR